MSTGDPVVTCSVCGQTYLFGTCHTCTGYSQHPWPQYQHDFTAALLLPVLERIAVALERFAKRVDEHSEALERTAIALERVVKRAEELGDSEKE